MKTQTLSSELWLPKPREEMFAFFADAANLQTITPDWLDFSIVSPAPIRMHQGARIDYRLKLHGFPLRWQSEIGVWEPPTRFVDTQIRGPYRLWVHEHHFEEQDGGTLVLDTVNYAVYGGKWIERILVHRDLERIFAFRRQKMLEIFGNS